MNETNKFYASYSKMSEENQNMRALLTRINNFGNESKFDKILASEDFSKLNSEVETMLQESSKDYHSKIAEYIEDLKVKRSNIDEEGEGEDYENIIADEYILNNLQYEREDALGDDNEGHEGNMQAMNEMARRGQFDVGNLGDILGARGVKRGGAGGAFNEI